MSSLALVLSILGGGGFLGILTTLVKVCMDYQKLKSAHAGMETTMMKQYTAHEKLYDDFKTLSNDYTLLKAQFTQNELRDQEERKENALKFNELYNSRNQTNEALIKLTTTVEMLVSNMNHGFDAVNTKIDEIKDEIKQELKLKNDSKR